MSWPGYFPNPRLSLGLGQMQNYRMGPRVTLLPGFGGTHNLALRTGRFLHADAITGHTGFFTVPARNLRCKSHHSDIIRWGVRPRLGNNAAWWGWSCRNKETLSSQPHLLATRSRGSTTYRAAEAKWIRIFKKGTFFNFWLMQKEPNQDEGDSHWTTDMKRASPQGGWTVLESVATGALLSAGLLATRSSSPLNESKG